MMHSCYLLPVCFHRRPSVFLTFVNVTNLDRTAVFRDKQTSGCKILISLKHMGKFNTSEGCSSELKCKDFITNK